MATVRLQAGQSPPLAVITPDDQRGVLYVTGGMALATAIVCLAVRAYVRLGFGQAVGSDDYAVIASFAFMTAQSIVMFVAAANGLGKTSTLVGHREGVSMQKAILAADIFYILAIWASRCSSIFFLRRLSRTTKYEWLWKAMSGLLAALALASLLTVSLRCDLSQAWLFIDRRCTGLFDRWLAATIFEIFFEAILFAQPAYLILNLQMPAKVKIKALGAFAGRLVIIIPLVLHLLAIRPFYKSTDGHKVTAQSMTRPYIYTQISLALAIVTPTIPMLQPFMQATATTFGTVSGYSTNSYGNARSGQNSRTWGSKQNTGLNPARSHYSDRFDGFKSRPEVEANNLQAHPGGAHDTQCVYTASVVHQQGRRVSNGSDVSQQPMIRRDVQYDISYSDRLPE